MMSEPSETICAMCGRPLSAHTVTQRFGIAHAALADADGRIVKGCSAVEADREYFRGKIDSLTTVVRSLRWRAGRLRTLRAAWGPDAVDAYANDQAREIERLKRAQEEIP